eukprot:m.141526 g.141526  ORF g.141526 m.141526 type:complete len:56 (-) comp11560_c0_seq18:131-298(-)
MPTLSPTTRSDLMSTLIAWHHAVGHCRGRSPFGSPRGHVAATKRLLTISPTTCIL